MAQDIRELLKQDKQLPSEMIKEGHEERFMTRLENELPKTTKKFDYSWLKIAASIVVILSVSMMAFNQFQNTAEQTTEIVDNSETKNATVVMTKQSSSLAEISPEYEKVESYLLTSIKFQLSQIKVDEVNRGLVESFMARLENLDKEYQRLNKELIDVGPNMQTVEAMMENLSMRLTLLNRLKDKLKELEKNKNGDFNEVQA